MFRAWIARASSAVPGECAVCRAWPSQPVCESCVARFAQPVARCRTCALPVVAGIDRCGACLRSPPPLDGCFAALSWGWPWTACIGDFKYRANPGWAATLALLLRSTPWVEPALDACDIVLPLPLSTQRLAERGFNQSLEIARRLAAARTDVSLLLRVRHTAAQRTLPREQRLRNLRGAFAVDPLRAASLRGRRAVLVDDVMTTGATLHAAAKALREAGAAHVTALVLARTDDH